MKKLEKYVSPTLDVETIEIEQGIAQTSVSAQHTNTPEVNNYEDGGSSTQYFDAN